MNPYLSTSLVFGLLLCIVYFFLSLKPTIYLDASQVPNETPEQRKARGEKQRSKRFVFGIGGVIGLCLVSYLMIAMASPAKKVYAALWPSMTPTASNTPTSTPTRTPSPTPRATGTSKLFATLTAYAVTPSASATNGPSAFVPSAGGGGSVTVIQTRIVQVIQTRVVYATQLIYVPMTVIVTATPTLFSTETPTVTPSATFTATYTETSTATPTASPTHTETPTP